MAEYRGQVDFRNIARTYPVDAHIECSFAMTATHVYNNYDWIGLFKVGWSNVRDQKLYIYVPAPSGNAGDAERQASVLFQAGNLPKEDGEFYQFIYINSKNKMCGASSPFQFRAPRTEDFIEEAMQDDDDMLFITTKHVKLEEDLNNLIKEREDLAKECGTMAQENEALNEHIKVLQRQLAELDTEKTQLLLQLQESKNDSELLNGKLEEQTTVAQAKYEELRQEIGVLSDQTKTMEESLAEKDNTLVQLRNELDHHSGQVEALRREKELYHEHSAKEEATKQQAVNELAALKQRLEVTEKEAFDTLQAQLNSSQETIQSLESFKQQQKTIIDQQHDKLQATEARHVVDAAEISTLNETLGNLSIKIEEVNTENHSVKSKLSKLKDQYQVDRQNWNETLDGQLSEKNGLLSTIGELNHKLEKMKNDNMCNSAASYDAQEDRYVALQAAYCLLKDELKNTCREMEALQRREAKLIDADRQVHELQQKLKRAEEQRPKNGTPEKIHKLATRSGTSLSESAPPLVRSFSASSSSGKGDLTKEELQRMVEQLGAELELRTQKKDKYKVKYLDEKQRAATLRDYFKGELEKQGRDLELARAQLDKQISPVVGDSFSYPPVLGAAAASATHSHAENGAAAAAEPVKRSASKQTSRSSKAGTGALEQSLIEVNTGERVAPLKPLPAPIEPQRVKNSPSREDADEVIRGNLALHVATTDHRYPPPIVYPSPLASFEARPRAPEVLVINRNEDSDDDNDGFHDASDILTSLMKCCVCDKVFSSKESIEMRTAHVNEHYAGTRDEDSLTNHWCPVCFKFFPKYSMSMEDFETHANSHFAQTN